EQEEPELPRDVALAPPPAAPHGRGNEDRPRQRSEQDRTDREENLGATRPARAARPQVVAHEHVLNVALLLLEREGEGPRRADEDDDRRAHERLEIRDPAAPAALGHEKRSERQERQDPGRAFRGESEPETRPEDDQRAPSTGAVTDAPPERRGAPDAEEGHHHVREDQPRVA